MTRSTLALLECPFCGGELILQPAPVPDIAGDEIVSGILSCACCAYPVVDGIAYIRTGPQANAAREHLGAARCQQALWELLEIRNERLDQFRSAVEQNGTFPHLAGILGGGQMEYLVYRFSDPTFVCAEAVAAALARDSVAGAGPILDFGGGAGHLTRVLSRESAGRHIVLADVSFWELWLARRIVAPDADCVCCDGNAPLPFRKGAFSLAVSADAFHYVWSRRLLAGELARAVAPGGLVALCHLHNADAVNWSAGMPLSARGYRALFDGRVVRVFGERNLLDAIWAGILDFSGDPADVELAAEPAFVLLAAADTRLLRRHALGIPLSRSLAPNPLYGISTVGGSVILRLAGASDAYEGEFGAFRQYLPEEVQLAEDWDERLMTGDPELVDLVRRRVLLDLPEGYA